MAISRRIPPAAATRPFVVVIFMKALPAKSGTISSEHNVFWYTEYEAREIKEPDRQFTTDAVAWVAAVYTVTIAAMQLAALHGGTAALPEITFEAPLQEAFGKNTAQAMLQGVFHGIRGMVWHLTEQYADRYGAYPLIIATGGDAEVLFADDELIERIVPELQFLGMVAAVRHALAPEADA